MRKNKLKEIKCDMCSKHLGYEAINFSDFKYSPKDYYECNNYKINHIKKGKDGRGNYLYVQDTIKPKTHIDVFYKYYNICPKCIKTLLKNIKYYAK